MTEKYYWLKMDRKFMDRHDIKIIKAMGGQKKGARLTLLYIMLLLESIDHNGDLRFSESTPYDAVMLAAVTGEEPELIQEALDLFKKISLIEINKDGTIHMANFKNMVGSTSKSRDRVRAWRTKRQEIEQHIQPINSHENNIKYGGNYYKIYERDDGECVFCGDNTTLLIHHLKPFNPADPDTCKKKNLITLCPGCEEKIRENKGYKELHLTAGNLHLTQEIELEKEKELEKDFIKEKIQKEKEEKYSDEWAEGLKRKMKNYS